MEKVSCKFSGDYTSLFVGERIDLIPSIDVFCDGILHPMIPYSLYIHIPFCQKRCSYCDFNTFAGQEYLIPEYMAALEKEIQCLRRGLDADAKMHTVYFGGGTPSIIPPDFIDRVLVTLKDAFSFSNDPEITLEANPGTVSLGYLQALHTAGITRLSIGAQSALPKELAILGRQHDYPDVIRAFKWARQAGFGNLSLDLIFGLPGQALSDWEQTLTLVLGLRPEHFSLYSLTIEEGTPLFLWADRGLLVPPDLDTAADMYELACERLEQAGYLQYEISNWARSLKGVQIPASNEKDRLGKNTLSSPYECRHNLQYWRNLPYLGLGAGAHGFSNAFRTANLRAPKDYIQCFTVDLDHQSDDFPFTPATSESTSIDLETEMQETMMMGLRLTQEGVSDSRFRSRFGSSLSDKFGNEIAKLADWGLLEWAGETLRLTPRGRLLGNRVFAEFV